MVDTLEMDIGALIDGLLYRNYEFLHYKSDAKGRTVRSINLVTSSLEIKVFNTMCYMYSAIYEAYTWPVIWSTCRRMS